jgi:hypothetical protein
MTDDFSPPEAKRQLWQKLRQIDVDAIARREKALGQLAAQLAEVTAAIPPAEAKAEAAEAKAKAKAKASAADAVSAKRDLQALVQERERLAHRQVEDMDQLKRKRDELAAFCKSKGIEA